MITTIIEEHHRWFHYVANGLLPPSHFEHDDVVQEGRVAMWRNYDNYDGRTDRGGSLGGFLRMAARRRMLDVAYQRKPHTGGNTDRNVRKPPTILLDDLLVGTELTADDVLPPAPNILENIELAYHRGDFAQAISLLTPKQRDYVVLRFWGGLYEPGAKLEHFKISKELAPEFSSKQTRASTWHAAKTELEQYLDHVRTGWGDANQ